MQGNIKITMTLTKKFFLDWTTKIENIGHKLEELVGQTDGQMNEEGNWELESWDYHLEEILDREVSITFHFYKSIPKVEENNCEYD